MKIRAVRWLVGVTCSVMTLAAAAPADAGLIPGIWNCLFGPCGGSRCCGPSYCGPTPVYYGPTYGGCGPSGCGPSGCGTVQSYYGWGNCGTPCAVACAPSSNCGVSSSAPAAGGSIAPQPDDGWNKRKTYENGAAAPGAAGTAAPENRTDADTGLPPRDRRRNPLNEDETRSGALRVPPAEESKGDADAESGKSDAPADAQDTKKSPMPGKIQLDENKDAQRIAPINLDEKIAWRPTALRQRLDIEPARGNARLIRVPLYAKSEWKPVPEAANVAKR